MAGYSDPLGSQTSPAQMMDAGRIGAFSGIPLMFPLTATQQHCISTDAGSSSMIPGAALITCIIRLTDTSQTQA